jgi:hypothetical protein
MAIMNDVKIDDYRNAVIKKTESVLQNAKYCKSFNINIVGGCDMMPTIKYEIEEIINIHDWRDDEDEKEEV